MASCLLRQHILSTSDISWTDYCAFLAHGRSLECDLEQRHNKWWHLTPYSIVVAMPWNMIHSLSFKALCRAI